MPNYPTLIPKTSTPTPETLPGGGIQLPALFSPDSATAQRVLEFFTANIRNPHTRKAYATAVRGFAAWTDTVGITHLRYVAPLHVAAYIEQLQSRLSAPSVKLQLAAIRMLFDWLVVARSSPPTRPAPRVGRIHPCSWFWQQAGADRLEPEPSHALGKHPQDGHRGGPGCLVSRRDRAGAGRSGRQQ